MFGNNFTTKQDIATALTNDFTMSYGDKMQLLSYLQNVSNQQVASFPWSSVLMGGGLGYAIAKFLFGLGMTGSVISSLLGSLIGYNIGKQPAVYTPPTPFRFKNFLGQTI